MKFPRGVHQEPDQSGFPANLDLVKKVLPAFRKRLADAGNLLDAKSVPFDQSQKSLGHPRFEELPGDQWQGHRMPENSDLILNGRPARLETGNRIGVMRLITGGKPAR